MNFFSEITKFADSVQVAIRKLRIKDGKNYCVTQDIDGQELHIKIPPGGGSSTPCVIPAKIVSKDGAFYNVSLWANGYTSAQTGTGVAEILMLNYADTLLADTKVLVLSSFVSATGGGDE